MGMMRFLVAAPIASRKTSCGRPICTGIDRTPWLVRAEVEQGVLNLEREVSDSAAVQVPWWVEGHGLLALSTGTLLEQSTPYVLPVELARGSVNQLRNQLSDWQMIGLVVPGEVGEKLSAAVVHLSGAVVRKDEPAEAAARSQQSLQAALDASQLLAKAYAEQAMLVRRRAGKPPPLLGGNLESTLLDNYAARQFLNAFNMAVVPICRRDVEASEGAFSWGVCDTQIEWCRTHGLRVCAGPLLQLDVHSLPDWIYLFEDDFENLQASATEFVRAAVTRYQGKVDVWQCAGRVSASEVLALSEEEKLLMTAAAIKEVLRGRSRGAGAVVDRAAVVRARRPARSRFPAAAVCRRPAPRRRGLQGADVGGEPGLRAGLHAAADPVGV